MAGRDILFIGVMIFAVAIAFFVIHFSMTTVVDEMLSNEATNSSASAVTSFNAVKDVTNKLDYVIFSLFIGLTLALIITGWFISGIPIFMGVYFIVVLIGVVLSTIMANVWEDTTQMTIFGSTITHFPITNNLLLNLPIYLSIIGVIGLVVMFAKPYFQN